MLKENTTIRSLSAPQPANINKSAQPNKITLYKINQTETRYYQQQSNNNNPKVGNKTTKNSRTDSDFRFF